MTAKQRIKILLEAFSQPFVRVIIIGYLIIFAVVSLLMMISDTSINTYGDALWYCFVSCTTIGFGDMVATSLISKLLTVIMFVLTACVLAVVTAVFVHVLTDIKKARDKESFGDFFYDLQHLDKLSKEELAAIAKRIREKK